MRQKERHRDEQGAEEVEPELGESLREIALGALFIAVTLFLPQGIVGLLRKIRS